MVFSSLVFLYAFLPACLIAYFFCNTTRSRNYVLLGFSLFFYAWGEPFWVIQMVVSGLIVFLAGKGIDHFKGNRRKQKLALGVGVTAALIPLFIFKYAGFFIENINALFRSSLPMPSFGMPIGISFYTFQVITYIVDLYREECDVQQHFPDLLLYEAFFPQLIAGPIVRYNDIDLQIRHREWNFENIGRGVRRFMTGLAKKVLVANYAAEIVRQTLDSGRLAQLSGLEAFVGMLAFTFQIYFDFSGYSCMAIGLGEMFGFELKENFNYPYIATSVTDFWRRWHISLSTFFRDYVYIPLGGRRRHATRNLIITWLLTGFWHGASWNFIFWGVYYLVFILMERAFLQEKLNRLPRIVSHLYIAPVIFFGWALFKFELRDLGVFLSRLFAFGPAKFFSLEGKLLFRQNIIFFLFALLASMPWLPLIRKRFPRLLSIRYQSTAFYFVTSLIQMVVILFFCTAALVANSFNPFLYFRF